ncbi:MAG: phosphatase PAP2 family protein [Lachnospiraceae bacterium]|nr:phosphatase PAP2 family protein [Lachnospiraceae bacterium]
MKKETYLKIMNKLENDELALYVSGFTTIFVFLIAVFYIILFGYQYFLSDKGFGFYVNPKDIKQINYVLVPLIGFIFVTIFRKKYNKQRPYELYEFTPLYRKYKNPAKRKHGQSFPSRHVYSAFAIGMACLSVNPIIGIGVLVMGFWLAIFRVVMGVHFPSDVIAGALIGIFLGLIGNFILPAIL